MRMKKEFDLKEISKHDAQKLIATSFLTRGMENIN